MAGHTYPAVAVCCMPTYISSHIASRIGLQSVSGAGSGSWVPHVGGRRCNALRRLAGFLPLLGSDGTCAQWQHGGSATKGAVLRSAVPASGSGTWWIGARGCERGLGRVAASCFASWHIRHAVAGTPQQAIHVPVHGQQQLLLERMRVS